MRRFEDKTDAPDEKMVDEGVKATRTLIQTFLQAVKACRLYETNHPILPKFLERLRNDFDHYFDKCDSFSLQVGERRLFYHGKAVYESQDVRESLAFFFFKDGIREIRFSKGLEFREIIDFLDIVRKSDFVNRLEDDLVTLVWEKDFSHIHFVIMDEFLESGFSATATVEDLAGGFDGWSKEKVDEDGSEGPDPLTVASLEQAVSPSPGQSLVQACQLSPNEMEEISREVQQEQQPEYVTILMGDLVEILLHLGEDMDAYENMISYFERMIHSFLEKKEVGKAVMILKHIKATMESIALKDKQIFAIRRILETPSSPHSIKLIEKAMSDHEEMDSNSFLPYLGLLTKQAVDPLCRSLVESESGKWKKVASETLVGLCREDIQPLTKFLLSSGPMLVCQILSILGRIGDPLTEKYLGNLVVHADPSVREETLQILGKFRGGRGELIEKFLRDSVAEIRGKASLILARVTKGQAVEPLLKIILSEDFYKRDYREKASFFRALGETGSKEVIPVLKKIARRRGWFQRAKWKEMRLCANNALKMVEAGTRMPLPEVKH